MESVIGGRGVTVFDSHDFAVARARSEGYEAGVLSVAGNLNWHDAYFCGVLGADPERTNDGWDVILRVGTNGFRLDKETAFLLADELRAAAEDGPEPVRPDPDYWHDTACEYEN